MRFILTIGLYLAYIRTFCDYLLTGNYSLMPTSSAGMLAQSSQLDQVLAQPGGIMLCTLFAFGCYGVALEMLQVLRMMVATPCHMDYWPAGAPVGTLRMESAVSAKPAANVSNGSTFSDYWGPAPQHDTGNQQISPTFSDYYFGPNGHPGLKGRPSSGLSPDHPAK